MKSFLLVLFFWGVGFSVVKGQVVDTVGVVREVDSLIQVSRGLTNNRFFDKALEINNIAENLTLEKFGKETALYGSICFNYGRIADFKDAYFEAEKWYIESLNIRAREIGKNHLDYAKSLNNLGILYAKIGQYEKSERLLLEAKDIREKHLKKEHPDYLGGLQNLAIIYSKYAQYNKAEALLLEVNSIQKRVNGEANLIYINGLVNLATVYYKMGQMDKATQIDLEALEIKERFSGKEDPDYIKILNNLARIYIENEQYVKAEPLLIEALEKEKKIGITENLIYCSSLNYIGILYSQTGRVKESIRAMKESASIYEKILGKDNLLYANCLTLLGNFVAMEGNYPESLSCYNEAMEIIEGLLGKRSLDFASVQKNLSLLYWRMRKFDDVEPLFCESLFTRQTHLQKSIYIFSEKALSSYSDKFLLDQYHIFSLAQIRNSKNIIKTCFNSILFYKGFLFMALSQVKKLALSDSVSTEKYNQLKSLQYLLASQYALPYVKQDSNFIDTLNQKADLLEKGIRYTVVGFNDAIRQVNWQQAQAQLQPNEAAIEFIHYYYANPVLVDSTLYAALILRPSPAGASAKEGDWSAPKWVTLCEQRQLNALLNTNNQRTESLNQLYSPKKESVLVSVEESPALYDLVWAPLDSLLDGVKTVYFAPSGLLHRLNLGALPINEKQTLSDRYNLHQVNSTRELVIPTQVTPGASDAVVYGGIQYEMDSTAIRSGNAGKDSILIGTAEISFSSIDRSLRGEAWTYLPGTEKESSQVGELLTKKGLKTTLRQGYAASEESFKKIGRDGQPSPKVLHIATHGFFFPDPKDTLQSKRWMTDREPAFKISEHPMIRSGLLLAGSNAAWTNQSRPMDMEDGILTAYEISQMNLRNTELVVLSACETGLGDIQGNEGVYGLQRAFKIAGAKYLLMSLWKVPDLQTQELMTAFYKEWSGDKTIPEAFRAAQNVMRKKYPGKPFLWAGFVLVE